MKIRAIIFDHDGTLVESYKGIAQCLQLTCNDLGKPKLTEDEILASIGPTLEERFAQLWGEMAAEEGARLYREHYEKHFLTGSCLIPGVKDTLDEIEAKGLLMACVTNKTWNYCLRQLEYFELADKMMVIYGNGQGFRTKPEPDMLFAALNHMKVKPDEAVMVGDTPIDVATAKAAGVRPWAVQSRYTSLEVLENADPEKIFDKFADIIDCI